MWIEFNTQASQEYRAEARGNIIPYGITYLDKALGGVTPTDLVFIGARSGAGKTSLTTMLASNVSQMNKNVYLFALEADRGEIETRLLYTEFAKLYYAEKQFAIRKPINYRDFSYGKYDSQYMSLIDRAEDNTNKKMSNVNILYRQESFTVDDFEAQVHNIKDYADLIILDHIHHFDMDTDRETSELKKIVKRLRDINILVKKPIVSIGHFRKLDRKTIELVPDYDEFYGSSEISKEATQIITLAQVNPELLGIPVSYHLTPTLFRISKFRRFSPVSKYVGLHIYNSNLNAYENKFKIYQLKKNGTEIDEVIEIPSFLREEEIREVQDALVGR